MGKTAFDAQWVHVVILSCYFNLDYAHNGPIFKYPTEQLTCATAHSCCFAAVYVSRNPLGTAFLLAELVGGAGTQKSPGTLVIIPTVPFTVYVSVQRSNTGVFNAAVKASGGASCTDGKTGSQGECRTSLDGYCTFFCTAPPPFSNNRRLVISAVDSGLSSTINFNSTKFNTSGQACIGPPGAVDHADWGSRCVGIGVPTGTGTYKYGTGAVCNALCNQGSKCALSGCPRAMCYNGAWSIPVGYCGGEFCNMQPSSNYCIDVAAV